MKHSFFPYIGGKFFLSKKIIELMPNHTVYIEVFGGSAKVLLYLRQKYKYITTIISNFLIYSTWLHLSLKSL